MSKRKGYWPGPNICELALKDSQIFHGESINQFSILSCRTPNYTKLTTTERPSNGPRDFL